jgi:hypothetical protein
LFDTDRASVGANFELFKDQRKVPVRQRESEDIEIFRTGKSLKHVVQVLTKIPRDREMN